MRKTILICFLIGSLVICVHYILRSTDRVEVIRTVKDSRGLYSVEYMQDGKTWALDYITKQQLDSLVNQ